MDIEAVDDFYATYDIPEDEETFFFEEDRPGLPTARAPRRGMGGGGGSSGGGDDGGSGSSSSHYAWSSQRSSRLSGAAPRAGRGRGDPPEPGGDGDGSEHSSIPTSAGHDRETRKKWRGGAAPAAPVLDITYENAMRFPKAYRRWVRAVEAWKIRVKHYLPLAEAALMLAEACRGDAALELEHVELSRLNQKDGIEHIVEKLAVFDEDRIQHTGRLMDNYDTVRRQPGMTVMKYTSLFLQAERDMEQAGIRVYDNESRAHKYLKGAQLQPADRRLVLTKAGDSYDYGKIKKAMLSLWPTTAPPHPSADNRRPTGRGGGGGGRKGDGKGHGGRRPQHGAGRHQVHVAEGEADDDAEEQQEEQDVAA